MPKFLRQYIDGFLFPRVHHRSRAAIERWQMRRLRSLVAHAGAYVPFYKALLKARGVTASDIRTLRDMPRLPALDKASFRNKPVEDFVDGSSPVIKDWSETSGTTGEPFSFLPGANFSDFARFRFLLWRGMRLRDLPLVKVALIKIPKAHPTKNKIIVNVSKYITDPEAVYVKLIDFQPDIIESYPTFLFEFAQKLSSHPSRALIKPRYVVCFGEMLTPLMRERIEEVLGCEIYDRYGTDEAGIIGVECARHDGFHANSESVIVEITDDAYAHVAENQYGRIVVTELGNYAMPFIRYDTGDYGRLTNEPCACGLKTPRLFVQGRTAAYLIFGTRYLHHLQVGSLLGEFPEAIAQCRAIKKSNEKMILEIIPGSIFTEEAAQRIREKIGSFVGTNVQVDIKEVTEIPRMPSGKSQVVVDESSAP